MAYEFMNIISNKNQGSIPSPQCHCLFDPKFQVPKMEVLNLIFGYFLGFPYISPIHTAYIGEMSGDYLGRSAWGSFKEATQWQCAVALLDVMNSNTVEPQVLACNVTWAMNFHYP